MSNDQINYQKPINQWKKASVILIILVVIFSAAIIVLSIQNAHRSESIANFERHSKENETVINSECASPRESNIAMPEIPQERYLTTKEWGIRFIIPKDFNNLTYEINGNRLDFSGLLSAEHTYYVDDFSINSVKDDFIYVVRYPAENDPEKGCIESCPGFIGSNSGYNYYVGHRQNWKYNSPTEEFQAIIANYLLRRMLFKVEFI